ncbi:MAG: ABC transporter ATP-binding protein [Spirochaetes bacterium]|nr:ABC transporter ATP-binding protein [Spirochaetota bacterium]
MPVIYTQGLRKTFGRVQALNGLDFSVEPGTVFGFLGPNGAGKTTAIRVLTGLARPTGGCVRVLGEDIVASRRGIAGRIGYLPEEPAFYPWMTAYELLDYIGRIFGLTAEERKVRSKKLLDLAGLTQTGGRRIGGFSRGMRQRLGLAQALVNRPEVLFLDEPVSAMDPAGRKEVLELIGSLRGQCTVFMSTHILTDVDRVCDTVGIINHGRMVVEAPREELIARYALPVFEIENDSSSAGKFAAWAENLRSMSWVATVSVNGTVVRVVVNNVEEAKKKLLASAIRAGLILTRYEMIRPSLEDVFLQLIGEEGKEAG